MAKLKQVGSAERMKAKDRAALMVQEADRQINEERSARISPPEIAASIGSSRSLVYSYFPDADHLIQAVLDRHADLLMQAGLCDALDAESLEDAVVQSSLIYCDHVTKYGAAIELCLREPRVAEKVGGKIRMLILSVLLRLGRKAMQELKFEPADALATVRILQVVPEDAARLIRSGKVSREIAQKVCRRLIRASLDELRPMT